METFVEDSINLLENWELEYRTSVGKAGIKIAAQPWSSQGDLGPSAPSQPGHPHRDIVRIKS